MYCVEIDVMIEAKMKEQAIFYLYKRYPQVNCAADKAIYGDGDGGTDGHDFPTPEWVKQHAIGCECCEGDGMMDLIRF